MLIICLSHSRHLPGLRKRYQIDMCVFLIGKYALMQWVCFHSQWLDWGLKGREGGGHIGYISSSPIWTEHKSQSSVNKQWGTHHLNMYLTSEETQLPSQVRGRKPLTAPRPPPLTHSHPTHTPSAPSPHPQIKQHHPPEGKLQESDHLSSLS